MRGIRIIFFPRKKASALSSRTSTPEVRSVFFFFFFRVFLVPNRRHTYFCENTGAFKAGKVFYGFFPVTGHPHCSGWADIALLILGVLMPQSSIISMGFKLGFCISSLQLMLSNLLLCYGRQIYFLLYYTIKKGVTIVYANSFVSYVSYLYI